MSAALSPDHPPNARAPEDLRVGLLGCGTVGSPVAKALLEDGASLARATGARLELARVAVRHPHKSRPVRLPAEIVTTDALAVAIDPGIDIVIEVIGGTDSAIGAILGALSDNKAVITANKGLLAGLGADLLDESELYFEAAVCGGIPIVRALKESCAGDRVVAFTGIFSGTCNFVLHRMTVSGCPLEDALAEAQRLGYAEADPAADIEGFDAAAKVAILARVAFGVPVSADDVARVGISGIDARRIADIREKGCVYRLVGQGRRTPSGVELWVRPELLSADDPLARVGGTDNAVFVTTERAGTLAFHGAGAGGEPTAAAILGDLVAAARRRVQDRSPVQCVP